MYFSENSESLELRLFRICIFVVQLLALPAWAPVTSCCGQQLLQQAGAWSSLCILPPEGSPALAKEQKEPPHLLRALVWS